MKAAALFLIIAPAGCAQPRAFVEVSRPCAEGIARIYHVSAPRGYSLDGVWVARANMWYRCAPLDGTSAYAFIVNIGERDGALALARAVQ